MRLDKWLMQNGYFSSRHRAQLEIVHGSVFVNGASVCKASYSVKPDDTVTIASRFIPYVSMGGVKLENAIRCFDLDVKGANVIDVGASTGGFTDCLLRHGAAQVYAVDVGRDQLVASLCDDPRVTAMEKTNFLDTDITRYDDIALVTIDVSFTSAVPSILHARALFAVPVVVLIKPQFEFATPPKKGVVRKKADHVSVLARFFHRLKEASIAVSALDYSPVKGGGGNIEFLCLLGRGHCPIDIHSIVENAHRAFQKEEPC